MQKTLEMSKQNKTKDQDVYMISCGSERPTHKQLCDAGYMAKFLMVPAAVNKSIFLSNIIYDSEDISFRRAIDGIAPPWTDECSLVILSDELNIRLCVVELFIVYMNAVFMDPIKLEQIVYMAHDMFNDPYRVNKLVQYSHDLATAIDLPMPSSVYLPQLLYLADFLVFDTQLDSGEPETKFMDANIMAHIFTIWMSLYTDRVPEVHVYRAFIDECISRPEIGYKVIHIPPLEMDPGKFPNVKYNMGVYYRCVFGVIQIPDPKDTQKLIDDDVAIQALKPLIKKYLRLQW